MNRLTSAPLKEMNVTGNMSPTRKTMCVKVVLFLVTVCMLRSLRNTVLIMTQSWSTIMERISFKICSQNIRNTRGDLLESIWIFLRILLTKVIHSIAILRGKLSTNAETRTMTTVWNLLSRTESKAAMTLAPLVVNGGI